MPIHVKVKSHYSLDEHAYVFASFVYAFLIVNYFDNDVVKKFIITKPEIFSHLEWGNILKGGFYFLLFFVFLLFIIESWWGSRLEERSLKSFNSYIIFLLHPFLLFLSERIVFDPELFQDNVIAESSIKITLRFFFILSMILGNLIFVRSYFSFKRETPQGWLKLIHRKEKWKFLANYVKNKNKDRIKTFFLSITLTLFLYLSNIPLRYQNHVVGLAWLTLIIAIITLYRHIKENEKKFNEQNYKIFLNNIAEQHLPFILRDKKDYGFLLFNNEKVPDVVTNCIINKIRHNDIYTTDDSQICCCFLTSNKDIAEFELWIKAWVMEADGEQFWRNNDITFSYREYRRTIFDPNYHKLEFFNTFRKAYNQFKI